jgi:Tfp pilus assembly protein PilF
MLDGKLDDARKRLDGVLSKDGSNQTARHWLADLDTMGGNNEAAIRLFREVVSSDSGNAEAYNNLAYLLIDRQPDEALKYAQRAVEIAPDRPAYADTLGWAMYRKGLYAAAIPHLERAAAKGGDAVWTYHLAMAYAKSGDLARGRRTLQAALKENPDVPEAKLAKEVIGQ